MRLVKKEYIMTNEKITKTPYIIRLTINEKNSETYRVSKDLFITIKNIIKPYQSFKNKPKKVKCIETGEIFENAKDANDMLIQKGISYSYDAYNRIKEVCNKKRKTAYGLHWEFIDQQNKNYLDFSIHAKINLWI